MAAWYDRGPHRGRPEPAVITGHVDSRFAPGNQAAFYELGAVRPGDAVDVARADHRVAVFRVDSVALVPKTGFPTRAGLRRHRLRGAAPHHLRRPLRPAHRLRRQRHRLRAPRRLATEPPPRAGLLSRRPARRPLDMRPARPGIRSIPSILSPRKGPTWHRRRRVRQPRPRPRARPQRTPKTARASGARVDDPRRRQPGSADGGAGRDRRDHRAALGAAGSGLHQRARQWIVTAYALAFGSLLLVGGRFADLFGRT